MQVLLLGHMEYLTHVYNLQDSCTRTTEKDTHDLNPFDGPSPLCTTKYSGCLATSQKERLHFKKFFKDETNTSTVQLLL